MEGGLAGEANEVAVAGLVLGKDEEMVVAVGELTVVGGLGDVEFAAKDGLEALLSHGLKEVHGAVHISVVRDGRGCLA